MADDLISYDQPEPPQADLWQLEQWTGVAWTQIYTWLRAQATPGVPPQWQYVSPPITPGVAVRLLACNDDGSGTTQCSLPSNTLVVPTAVPTSTQTPTWTPIPTPTNTPIPTSTPVPTRTKKPKPNPPHMNSVS